MKKLKFNPPVLEFVPQNEHKDDDDQNVQTPERYRRAREGCDCRSCRIARQQQEEANLQQALHRQRIVNFTVGHINHP